MSKKIHSYKWDKIDNAISAVAVDAGRLQDKIHAIAVSILRHWMENPTAGTACATKMNALMEASPYHRKAFSVWCAASVDVLDRKRGEIISTRLCPMKWSEDNQKWYVHKDDRITGKQFIAARDNPFWTVSPPSKAAPYNDIKAMEAALETAMKKAKAKKEGDIIHIGMLMEIREAITKAKNAA